MTTEHSPETNETQDTATRLGPGAVLRVTRLEKSMAIADVATALHLSKAMVERLEADDFNALPPSTFTKGYLRSYAMLLGANVDDVLARYPDSGAREGSQPLKVTRPVTTSPDISPGMVRGFLLGGVVALLVGAGVWLYPTDETGPSPVATESTPAEPPPAEAPEGGELAEAPEPDPTVPPGLDPDENGLALDEPDEEQLFTDDLAGPPSAQVPDDEPVDLPPADGSELAAETEDDEPEAEGGTSPAGGPEELQLRFSGPSWVEVYDADGERLLYGLIQDDGARRVRGPAPFSVVIGDANHVAVVYRDEEVEMGNRRPGRVVRIQVPD